MTSASNKCKCACMTTKTEKMNTDPKFDTNWNDLSVEMKFECIMRMPLKTRVKLRLTSKTERCLVDQKNRFRQLIIGKVYTFFFIRPTTKWEIHRRVTFENTALIAAVLRNNPVDELRIMDLKPNLIREIGFHYELKDKWMIYSLPTQLNFKLFHMDSVNLYNSQFAVDLAHKWIKHNNMLCGTRFRQRLSLYGNNTMELFLEQFKDRILEQTEYHARISTNNARKHIILRIVPGIRIPLATTKLLSCAVIPFWVPTKQIETNEDMVGDFEASKEPDFSRFR